MRFINLLSYLLYLVLALVLTLFILPYVINWNNYKDYIIKNVSRLDNLELSINGEIKVSFLPIPQISIKQIQIKGENYSIESALLKSNLFLIKLLNGKIEIKNITFVDNIIDYKLSNFLPTSNRLLNAIQNNNIKTNKLTLRNSAINFYDIDQNKQFSLANLNIKTNYYPKQKSLNINSEINNNINLQANIKSLDNDNYDTKIKINSKKSDHIGIKGKLNIVAEKLNFLGDLNAEIHHLQELLPNLQGVILQNIKQKSMFKLTSNVQFQNDNLTLDEIKVKGIAIEGEDNNINLSLADFKNILFNFNINLNSLNLDDMIYINNINQEEKENYNTINKINNNPDKFNIDFINNLNFDFKTNIKTIILNKETLNDLNIKAELHNKKLILHSSNITLPYNTRFELSGTATENHIRPIFHGKLFLYGQDLPKFLNWLGYDKLENNDNIVNKSFSFNSDIFLTPKYLVLPNMRSTLTGITIDGHSAIRFRSSPIIDSDITVSSFNMDNYKINHYLYNLINKIQNSNNSEFFSLFTPIRTFPFDLIIDLNTSNITLNNESISNFTTLLNIKNGLVTLDQIKLMHEDANILGKILLDVRSLKPKIDIQLSGLKLDKSATKPFNNISRNLNFYNLDKVDGNINLNFARFILTNNLTFRDLNLHANLYESVITINNINANVFGGKLISKANILTSTDNFILNSSIGFEKINLAEFLPNILGVHNIDGLASIVGAFNSKGRNFEEWLNNLQGNFSFSGVNNNIYGINLQDLTKLSLINPSQAITINEYNKVIEESFSHGNTIFDKIEGTFLISKGVIQTNNIKMSNKSINAGTSTAINIKDRNAHLINNFVFTPTIGSAPINTQLTIKGIIGKKITKEIITNDLRNYMIKNNLLLE